MTMERKPPSKVLQLKAVCITTTIVLRTKTPGPPRRARGLPSFIYMISITPINVLFHYFSSHRVRPVDPGTRRLVLCNASRSWTSNVLISFLLPEAAARRATVRSAGVKAERVSA